MQTSGLDEWMKKPEAERKAEEATMKADWDKWVAEHSAMLHGTTAGIGRPKRITASGVTDERNDLMLYSVVEGESHEAVADMFKNHPHFGIPGAWIEVMPINMLPGMEAK